MKTLGERNNNPGNLKDPRTGKFLVFNTPQEGLDALRKDLAVKATGQSTTGIKPGMSILEFAKKWAPKTDNNIPEDWAKNVANALGVTTAYAWDGVPQEQFAKAVQVAEGTTGITSNNTMGKKKLTRNQIIANISAMQKQGGTQEQIQAYLNSLKDLTDVPAQKEMQAQKNIQGMVASGGAKDLRPANANNTERVVGTLGNVALGAGKEIVNQARGISNVANNTMTDIGRATKDWTGYNVFPQLGSNATNSWYNPETAGGKALSATLQPVGTAQNVGKYGLQAGEAAATLAGTGAGSALVGLGGKAAGLVPKALGLVSKATVPGLLYALWQQMKNNNNNAPANPQSSLPTIQY